MTTYHIILVVRSCQGLVWGVLRPCTPILAGVVILSHSHVGRDTTEGTSWHVNTRSQLGWLWSWSWSCPSWHCVPRAMWVQDQDQDQDHPSYGHCASAWLRLWLSKLWSCISRIGFPSTIPCLVWQCIVPCYAQVHDRCLRIRRWERLLIIYSLHV